MISWFGNTPLAIGEYGCREDPGVPGLAAEWLRGWVAAACEQEPALASEAGAYQDRRLAQAAAGELRVTVGHADLLVLP